MRPLDLVPMGHSPLLFSSKGYRLLPPFLVTGADRTGMFLAPGCPGESYLCKSSRSKCFCCNMFACYIFLDQLVAAINKSGSLHGNCSQAAEIKSRHVTQSSASCTLVCVSLDPPADRQRCNIEQICKRYMSSIRCRQLLRCRKKHSTICCRLPPYN